MLYESTIFKNEYALSFEYLPELLPHREQEIKLLAKNIEPASKNRKPQNTFIFGPPGIGKTAVTKFVFREFEENYSNVKTIYINCWDFNTSVSIISKICLDLGVFVQRRGWAKDEILNRLLGFLNKNNKAIIVALDEVDQLIFKDSNALYDLLRINQYTKVPFGVVFISNDPLVFSNVEPRIKSSLAIDEIEFKPYNLEEMKDILKERASLAFYSFDNAIITLAANHAIKKGGDVRAGLEVLLRAGRLAEEKNDNKVKVEHAKKVLKKITKVKPKILKEKITDHEKTILKILTKDGMNFKELYKKYAEIVEKPLTEKMVKNYLKHLEKIKLIEYLKTKKLFRKT
jgi:cell division control protein 6